MKPQASPIIGAGVFPDPESTLYPLEAYRCDGVAPSARTGRPSSQPPSGRAGGASAVRPDDDVT